MGKRLELVMTCELCDVMVVTSRIMREVSKYSAWKGMKCYKWRQGVVTSANRVD